MADIVGSLFGSSTEQLQRDRLAQEDAQARAFAGMDRNQQAQYAGYKLGGMLGRGAGQLLGIQDPELARASALEKALSETQQEVTSGDPLETYSVLAKKLAGAGLGREALQAQQEVNKLSQERQLNTAKTQSEQMQAVKYGAEAQLKSQELQQANNAQEAMKNLFAEGAKLGVRPTQDDIIEALSPFVSPDKLATLTQQSYDKAQYRDFALNQATIAGDARVEAAKQRQADRKEIEQIKAENAKQLALIRGEGKGKDGKPKVGVYERIYGNQTINSAAELDVAATNLNALTRGGADSKVAGAFSNLANNGILSASAKVLGTVITKPESLQYESIMRPVLTNIGTLQNGGRRPTVNQTDILEKALIAKEGEPYVAQIQKMGEIRQMAEAAFRGAMTNDALSDEQKALLKDIEDSVKQAIPFTGLDVIKYSQAAQNNPSLTLQQYLDNTKRQDTVVNISPVNPKSITKSQEKSIMEAVDAVANGRWTKAGAVKQLKKLGIEVK